MCMLAYILLEWTKLFSLNLQKWDDMDRDKVRLSGRDKLQQKNVCYVHKWSKVE